MDLTEAALAARRTFFSELVEKFEGNEIVVFDPESRTFFLWGGGRHVEAAFVHPESTHIEVPHVFELSADLVDPVEASHEGVAGVILDLIPEWRKLVAS